MISTQDVETLPGTPVLDSDGDKVGDVAQVYVSDEGAQPLFVTVKTGLFGTKETFVPLDDATLVQGALHVRFDKTVIKDAPRVEADDHLSDEEQNGLFDYYEQHGGSAHADQRDAAQTDQRDTARTDQRGMDAPAATDRTDDAAAAGAAGTAATGFAGGTGTTADDLDATRTTRTTGMDRTDDSDSDSDAQIGTRSDVRDGGAAGATDAATGPQGYGTGTAATGTDTAATGTGTAGTGTADDAITLSEERMKVGTQRVESSRARLRKHVVTEQRTVTVPVTHDELRVEREPIGADEASSMPAAEIGEDEREIVLTEERPVVDTEVVPVERVRLSTEQVTEQRDVTGEVRREQLDTDGTNGDQSR